MIELARESLENLITKNFDLLCRYQKILEKEKILLWKGEKTLDTLNFLENIINKQKTLIEEIKMIRNALK